MPITVYGAGAIGGITGAALTRAGHNVLLVDRREETPWKPPRTEHDDPR